MGVGGAGGGGGGGGGGGAYLRDTMVYDLSSAVIAF